MRSMRIQRWPAVNSLPNVNTGLLVVAALPAYVARINRKNKSMRQMAQESADQHPYAQAGRQKGNFGV